MHTVTLTKEDLVNFEQEIADIFATGVIRAPVHLRAGREGGFRREVGGDEVWRGGRRRPGGGSASNGIDRVAGALDLEVVGGIGVKRGICER